MIEFNVFLKAANDGDLTIVQKYIAENKNDVSAINKTRKDGYQDDEFHRYGDTALICAARHGHFAIVKVLLAVNGIDMKATDSRFRTALMYGASATCYAWARKDTDESREIREAYINIVHALLAAKDIHSIDTVDGTGWTALMHAASSGVIAIVEALLNAGADTTLASYPWMNPWQPYGQAKTAEMIASDNGNNAIRDLIKFTTATRAVAKNIDYIQENLNIQDGSKLKDPIFSLANLFSTDEQYKKIAHQLYGVAADLGHVVAERIVENFRNGEDNSMEIDKNDSNQSQSVSNADGQRDKEKIREARLRFFEKSQQNNSQSLKVMDCSVNRLVS